MLNDLVDTSKSDKKIERDGRKRNRYLSDIRFILSSPEGRRFLYKVMEDTECFRSDIHENDNHNAYLIGRRSVGLNIYDAVITAKPQSYLQMINERSSEVKSEENLEKQEESAQG